MDTVKPETCLALQPQETLLRLGCLPGPPRAGWGTVNGWMSTGGTEPTCSCSIQSDLASTAAAAVPFPSAHPSRSATPPPACLSWLEAGGPAVQRALEQERRYAEGWLQRSAPLARRLEREMLRLVPTSQVPARTGAQKGEHPAQSAVLAPAVAAASVLLVPVTDVVVALHWTHIPSSKCPCSVPMQVSVPERVGDHEYFVQQLAGQPHPCYMRRRVAVASGGSSAAFEPEGPPWQQLPQHCTESMCKWGR